MNCSLINWRSLKIASVVAFLLAMSLVFGCHGVGTGGTGSGDGPYVANGGAAQKGPLVLGSLVTVQELKGDLSPNGKQYTYQITSDLGVFEPTSKFTTPYLGLAATGYYFDEVQNAVSTGPVTLMGLADVSADQTLNVNILTTLTYQRIKTLLAQKGLSFTDARAQAEKEALKAFHITNASYIGHFTTLDLSKNGEGDKALAAISCIFAQGNSAGNLSQLVADFQADLADNGVIDNPATLDAIAAASKAVNTSAVAANLTARYRAIGATFTATGIADYLDQDGDGVIGKYQFLTSGAVPPPGGPALPVYVVGPDDGTALTATAGTLMVNGQPTGTSSTTVNVGDSVTVLLPQPSRPGDSVIAYLDGVAGHVARFTLQNPTSSAAVAATISSIGYATDVTLSGDGQTLFVTSKDSGSTGIAGDGGLYIFNVADPTNPVKVSTMQSPSPGYGWIGYYGVELSGNSGLAFVASILEMKIFDVSTPATPQLVTSMATPGGVMALKLSPDKSFAYLSNTGLAHRVDLSDPHAPAIVGSTALQSPVWGLTISPDGSQLIGAGQDNTELITISGNSLASILLYGKFATFVTAASFIGDKTLLTAGRDTIGVYDMSNPAAPRLIGSASSGAGLISGTPGLYPTNGGIRYDSAARKAYVMVGNVLQVLDLSDPTHPLVTAKVTLATEPLNVIRNGITASADGSTVYVVNNGKVVVVRVS